MSAEDTLLETEDAMQKAVDYLLHEFATVRTGKATPALIENIDVFVRAYNSVMKLKGLAIITTPDARMLEVKAFDPSTTQDIERAIRESKLGLNPAAAGTSLRIPIPELSEERRRDMVKLEDAFIDQAFSLGEVPGITPEEAKKYIRYIADRRLLQVGLKPNYRVKENPLPWLDWVMNAPTHTNFFEQRSTEYGKGEIEGWSNAFDFLTPRAENPPLYRVYTMPGCPHCTRALAALDERTIAYEAILIDDAEARATLKAQNSWKTFPMVFALDSKGVQTRFVGGADALVSELVGP